MEITTESSHLQTMRGKVTHHDVVLRYIDRGMTMYAKIDWLTNQFCILNYNKSRDFQFGGMATLMVVEMLEKVTKDVMEKIGNGNTSTTTQQGIMPNNQLSNDVEHPSESPDRISWARRICRAMARLGRS